MARERQLRAVIATGEGRYADPWHPYPATSERLARILTDVGFSVAVSDVDGAMTRLDDAALLVVNAGDPWRDPEEEPPGAVPARSVDGLRRALERGIGVIGMHAAVASLRDYPDWAPAIGRMWVPGLSWHPPHGIARVRSAPGGGEAAATPFAVDAPTVDDFEVEDERYIRLQQIGDSRVIGCFSHDGADHPAVWMREYRGSRVAGDVLGHDERSYDSAGHRELIGRLALWAARA